MERNLPGLSEAVTRICQEYSPDPYLSLPKADLTVPCWYWLGGVACRLMDHSGCVWEGRPPVRGTVLFCKTST